MKQSRRFGIICIVAAAAMSASLALADFNLFGQKPAVNPQASLELTAKEGPWLITAFVFTGTEAKTYADKLCLELRRDFRLPAYVFHKEIRQSNEVQGRGIISGHGNVKSMKHMKDPNVNSYIVFVGNFSSIEDQNAQNTLRRVRQLKPKTLQYHGDFDLENPLAEDFAAHGLSNGQGPMGRAFLTKNPLVTQQEMASASANYLDPKVVGFNKNVKYSLLDCPGKYSVQIATFRGFRTINQNEIEKIRKTGEVNAKNTMTLAEADEAAAKLTAALRRRGIAASCFRDHYASIVTVGSFNDISIVNPQTGQTEAIPEIQRMYKEYGATQDPTKGNGPESVRLKVIDGIPLDPAPMIINVPRAPKTSRSAGLPNFWGR